MAPTFSRLAYAAVRFPFDLTVFSGRLALATVPSLRPCPQWTFRQAFGVHLLRLIVMYVSLLDLGNTLTLAPGAEGSRFQAAPPALRDLYRGPLDDDNVRPGKVGMTWYKDAPSADEIQDPGFSVVLHFHGGACVVGDGREKDMGFLARTLLHGTGVRRLCAPQYRLASPSGPDHFPAAVQDAVTVWLHLTRTLGIPASRIVLSGDSAGANIALALLRYLREHGAGLGFGAPAAVMLWSPWVDVDDATRIAVSRKRNHETDYVSTPFARWGSLSYTRNGGIDARHPYISPLHAPFYSEVFADTPVFVQTGELEVLYYDDILLADRMEEAGWRVRMEVSPRCPHDIMAVGPVIGFVGEARQAAAKAREFLEENTALPLGK